MSQPQTAAEIKDVMMQLTQIVQFILPLITVLITIFIAWQLAAGLALYRMTSLLLNMIQQYFVTGWGSLLTVPHVAGISDSGDIKSNTHRPQAQPPLRSSSKAATHRKGASARRRRKPSKKNGRRE